MNRGRYSHQPSRAWRAYTGIASLAAFCLAQVPASSAPVYQPPGSSLTYGDVTHSQRFASGTVNPAAAAADVSRARSAGNDLRTGTVISAVAGLEFGHLDRYYERLDEIASAISPGDPGGNPGEPAAPGDPGGGTSIGDIIEVCCPNLADLIDRIADELADRVALLTLISVDGYAKAFRSLDAPVMIGSYGGRGAWSFGINWSESSKAYGIADTSVDFDPPAALADLTSQYDLMPGDPVTRYDLVGDVDVIVDPETRKVGFLFDNDSTMLTKASRITELWWGYSRELGEFAGGDLFIGVDASYYALELSRLGVRYGDITNAKDVFESIRDADFRRDDAVGFNLGALWVADRFQLGASLINLNQPGFEYPRIDTSGYSEDSVVQQLVRDRRYVMERQLKLEASIFNEGRRRTINFGLDTVPVPDPMRDEFQWLTVSAGFELGARWASNLRVGYRRNLAGSKLAYLGIGATVFRWFNVDIATELDSVEIDKDRYPRGALMSLGVQLEF